VEAVAAAAEIEEGLLAWPVGEVRMRLLGARLRRGTKETRRDQRQERCPRHGFSTNGRAKAYHSSFEASRAPSASEASFIHTILESTCRRPAKVPKPQSTPAMTFSAPTTPPYCTMPSATSSRRSTNSTLTSIP